MTIRVGESWQARNGRRRWVSMGLGTFAGLSLLGAFIWLPLLLLWWVLVFEAWLAAESVLLLATAVLAVVALARHEARWGDLTVTRVRFGLRMVDVKGGRQ